MTERCPSLARSWNGWTTNPFHLSVVRAGPVLVLVEGNADIGQYLGGTGRLIEENHAQYTEDALFSRGVVRRTWVVPEHYDRSDPAGPPVYKGLGEPLEVTDAIRAALSFADDWEVRLEVEVVSR